MHSGFKLHQQFYRRVGERVHNERIVGAPRFMYRYIRKYKNATTHLLLNAIGLRYILDSTKQIRIRHAKVAWAITQSHFSFHFFVIIPLHLTFTNYYRSLNFFILFCCLNFFMVVRPNWLYNKFYCSNEIKLS